MFGLLGIGAGILGLLSTRRGQRRETQSQLDAIASQDAALDKQLSEEQRAYRDRLRAGRNQQGSGSFAGRLATSRSFTGF